MSANEMADDLDKFGQLFKDVALMLRQQSDRIVALEQKHKDAFDYIEKLLKERNM
jgi:hypothetical protein